MSRRRKAAKPAVPGSKAARRVASVMLEVMAGQLTPARAAEALGVSNTQYYKLEARALEGLVLACEPRGPGRHRTPEQEVEQLQQEIVRLQREGARLQALVRTMQRTVGMTLPREEKKKGEESGKKKRKRKKPTVRALKLAEQLRESDETGAQPEAEAERASKEEPAPTKATGEVSES